MSTVLQYNSARVGEDDGKLIVGEGPYNIPRVAVTLGFAGESLT